jgi:hypothetical protein
VNAAPSIFGFLVQKEMKHLLENLSLFSRALALISFVEKPTIEKEGRRQGRMGPDLSSCDGIFWLKNVMMNEMKWVKMK